MRSRELVTVAIGGEAVVHLPPGEGSDYATLCGLDGGLPAEEGEGYDWGGEEPQLLQVTRPGARVTCPTCAGIWRLARSCPPRLIETP